MSIKTKIKNILKKIIKPLLNKAQANYFLIKYKKNKYENLKFNYLNILKETDLEKFKKIKHEIESKNIERLKSKTKIKIGFLLYTTSMWSCDKLYNMLRQSDRFDPYIIVCGFNDGNEETIKKNYESTLNYFKEKSYQVVGLYEKKNITLYEAGNPDIIFYLTPFSALIPSKLNIENIPLKTLTIYISYSFMLADREKKFELPVYYLTWKYFSDTLMYKELIRKKSMVGDDNVIFCGYIRMDELINDIDNIRSDLWKIPKSQNRKVFKIIYAPHHSVFDEVGGFSTFDQNYEFMYELAKKYSKNTSWIIKPHPLLGSRIIKNGFFKDISEYDKYLKRWEELPNAKVVTSGTYFDIFKSSDAMILDSVSFLAEYQYVKKPLLLLTRKTQHFNPMGEALKEVLYCAEGNEFNKIEEFLNYIVIEGNDLMNEKREEFFNKYLNYYEYNGKMLSSEFIYKYLDKNLKNR